MGFGNELHNSLFLIPFDFHRSYVKRLIQTKESMSLLKLDDEMVRSTKKLDSDIRMLVYENYNKFIEATDTIRKMKQNVEVSVRMYVECIKRRLLFRSFVHSINKRLWSPTSKSLMNPFVQLALLPIP